MDLVLRRGVSSKAFPFCLFRVLVRVLVVFYSLSCFLCCGYFSCLSELVGVSAFGCMLVSWNFERFCEILGDFATSNFGSLRVDLCFEEL